MTDVTEFKVKDQRVYLSPVVDLFTQEVIAYKIAKNARLPLVTEMLKDAIANLSENSKPILHSDQGWQYRHKAYQNNLSIMGSHKACLEKETA